MIKIIFKNKNNNWHRENGPAFIDNIGRSDYWLNNVWQSYSLFVRNK